MSLPKARRQRGFTLIELILVSTDGSTTAFIYYTGYGDYSDVNNAPDTAGDKCSVQYVNAGTGERPTITVNSCVE